MRKTFLSSIALCLAALTVQAQVAEPARDAAQRPSFSPVKVEKAASVVMPKRVRAMASAELQAAFSVQGASSQKTVWSENFDQGSDGWTLANDADNYVKWSLKSKGFSEIESSDVQSLFVEGPYQVYRRAIAHATSAAVAVPTNGTFHAYVKYSESFNDYAVLTLSVSTDDFATSTELWNSAMESGHTGTIWHKVEADIAAFAGKNVKFRFTYGPGLNDTFKTGGYMSDFAIDGLAVKGVASVEGVNVATGEVVKFADLSQGAPVKWQWAFPGGTPATSTEQNPQVFYKEDGTYDVTLTVIDAQGAKSTVTRNGFVTVTGKAPVARILPPATFREASTRLPLVAPLAPVQYADASTGFPTQWNWTFTGASPATSTQECPKVSYEYLHKQTATLEVANSHGKSTDQVDVTAEYQAVINNIMPGDVPITYSLGEGTFPGSNRMGITEYGERFSKPSRPLVVYGAYVYFVTNKATSVADQIQSIGVHLRESENGLPGKKLESAWWSTFELETGGSTLVGTEFEFPPTVVNDEFWFTVDGIPEWNDSCNVSFAMAKFRTEGNTAYMLKKGKWVPLTGYFEGGEGGQTSFYIFPMVAHSVITTLPVGIDEIKVPATAGTVEQQIYSVYGYKDPVVDANWCRIMSKPNGLTLDTLKIAYDALPEGMKSRTATITLTDGFDTLTLKVTQKAEKHYDVSDVTLMVNMILGTVPEDKEYDFNGDGRVDVSDVTSIINIILAQ
ncbi:MAG: PKD domain-containing protein [Bacteroidales bacterium]|nr:PKD domain-containing protein [Bacteroidales bacterium]